MTKRIAGIVVGLLLLGWPGVVEATNGAFITGRGARDTSRGSSDAAVGSDGLSSARNPAGMSFVWGHRVDENVGLWFPDIRFENDLGSDRSEARVVPGASFGTVYHVGREFRYSRLVQGFGQSEIGLGEDEVPPWEPGYQGSPWSVGFAVYPLAGGKTDMELLTDYSQGGDRPTRPGPREWEYFNDTTVVAAGPSFAYRFSERFSVGVSLHYVHGLFEQDSPIEQPREVLQGRTKDSTPGEVFADLAALSNTDRIVGFADMDDVSSFGFHARVGTVVRLNPEWNVGFYVAPRTYVLDYLGKVTVDYSDQIEAVEDEFPGALESAAPDGPDDPEYDPDNGFRGEYNLRLKDFQLPTEIGLGTAYRPAGAGGRLLLSADVRYIAWSRTMDTLEAELTDGTNTNLNILTGSDGVDAEVPLDWRDQVVIALGATIAPVDGVVGRVGYNFGNRPVPRSTLLPTIPATPRHHVSFGGSYYWGLTELSFSFEYAVHETVDIGRNKADSGLNDSSVTVGVFGTYVAFGINF